jgi:hypothetical protein
MQHHCIMQHFHHGVAACPGCNTMMQQHMHHIPAALTYETASCRTIQQHHHVASSCSNSMQQHHLHAILLCSTIMQLLHHAAP